MKRVLVETPPYAPDGGPAAAADLVEARLDLDPGAALALGARARSGRGPAVLVTLRSRREGGRSDATPAVAAARLLAPDVLDAAAWVDVEADVAPQVAAAARAAGRRVLASAHGDGPIVLPRDGVDAWKVARPCDDGPALVRALEEARRLARASVARDTPPAFVVPYGRLGAARVVTAAVAEGAGVDAFVFGRAAEVGGDLAVALGGVPVLAELLDELRLGEVSGRARLYGLVGRPPHRSPSPSLHNAVFRALGLDAVYLPAADLDAEEAVALPFAGFSVTTPRKEEVAARCDVLDDVARRCGAVNTVVRGDDGRLHGWNTDALAVAEAVAERGVRGGGALVLGGGGFARAALAALVAAGFSVRCAGSERARRAAEATGATYVGPDGACLEGDAVLVNATPVGADGTLAPPWSARLATAPPGLVVLDAPYAAGARPAAFARAARARGLDVEDGGALLLRQAAGQALRFSGRPVAREVLGAALDPAGAVALVGPRGAGKSTVGRAVAARLGRPFVDTDDALARRVGRPAGRVLAEEGEPAFRAAERAAVAQALATRRGVVVALGGGALLDPATRARLARGVFVVRLGVSAPVAAGRLAGDPTPRPRLTEAADLETECARVAAEREPLYAAVAHETVPTDGRAVADVVTDVVGHVLRAWARRAP
ncbi:MAG: type I 3-dehydroquinate dehydratase [Planctomycetes bacterium]|nr:type I 3-dehydroquinate dehydratase [Planctomycetota bacterium]